MSFLLSHKPPPKLEKLIPEYETMEESNAALVDEIGKKINTVEDLKYFAEPSFQKYASQTLGNDVKTFFETDKLKNTIVNKFMQHLNNVFAIETKQLSSEMSGGERLSDFTEAKARRIANQLCLTNDSICKREIKFNQIVNQINDSVSNIADNFNRTYLHEDEGTGNVHYDNVVTDEPNESGGVKTVGDVIRTVRGEMEDEFIKNVKSLIHVGIRGGSSKSAKRPLRKTRKHKRKSNRSNTRRRMEGGDNNIFGTISNIGKGLSAANELRKNASNYATNIQNNATKMKSNVMAPEAALEAAIPGKTMPTKSMMGDALGGVLSNVTAPVAALAKAEEAIPNISGKTMPEKSMMGDALGGVLSNVTAPVAALAEAPAASLAKAKAAIPNISGKTIPTNAPDAVDAAKSMMGNAAATITGANGVPIDWANMANQFASGNPMGDNTPASILSGIKSLGSTNPADLANLLTSVVKSTAQKPDDKKSTDTSADNAKKPNTSNDAKSKPIPQNQMSPVFMPPNYTWQTVRNNVINNVDKLIEHSLLTSDMENQIRYNIKHNVANHLFDYKANSKLNEELKKQFDRMILKMYSSYIDKTSSDELKLLILQQLIFYKTTQSDESDSLIVRIIKHKTADKIAKSFVGKEPALKYQTDRSPHIDTIKPPEVVDIPPYPPVPAILKSNFILEKYESLLRGFFYKSNGAYIEPVFNAISKIMENVELNPTDVNHVYYTATIEFCKRMRYLFQNNPEYIQWKIRKFIFSDDAIVRRDYFEIPQKNAKTICHFTFNSERPLAQVMSLFVWVKLQVDMGNEVLIDKQRWVDTLKELATASSYGSDPELFDMLKSSRYSIYGRSDASDSQILLSLGLTPSPEEEEGKEEPPAEA